MNLTIDRGACVELVVNCARLVLGLGLPLNLPDDAP